ncbi:aminoglycoside phosphotransferase family protein [Deinococcus frigens]|uniref:aminoglycoside phosphotransferase family protein n=1 Tax=Deinococcus frigens TaxID=249403 RepID=UPI000B00CF03|nr:aminoglycoside phosphotransferase family protein [Deinococcus frigens]
MPSASPTLRRETTLTLLFTRGEEVALHSLTTAQTSYYGANVLEAAREAGLSGTLLRRLYFKYFGEVAGVRRAESVWHLEAADGLELDWQPISGLPQRERAWVDTAHSPPGNAPWMRPGWHAAALAWLDAELAAQGWTRQGQAGQPSVLKHGQISVLWRVDTSGGRVYFKAVPDFFRREVEVTPLLARELPGAAPSVLAADTRRGFLLLRDAGEENDTPDLSAVMRHLAGIQRASLPLLDGWALRDRGPDHVLSWLDRLLSDATLLTGQEGGFTPGEAERLRSHAPELEAALRRLSASPLPCTLGHGDLHGGNVVERGGRFTFLDWSDVCVTHPFLDASPAYFLGFGEMDDLGESQLEALAAATAAYLHAWTDFAPLEELRALFNDALTAGELLRALGYVDGIQPAVQDKTEWHGAHLEHLRRALTRLEKGEAPVSSGSLTL